MGGLGCPKGRNGFCGLKIELFFSPASVSGAISWLKNQLFDLFSDSFGCRCNYSLLRRIMQQVISPAWPIDLNLWMPKICAKSSPSVEEVSLDFLSLRNLDRYINPGSESGTNSHLFP